MIELLREGPIARLHIRRADKKNAMSEAMWRSLRAHCAELAQAPPRVLVVQGEPGVFCAGADIEEMQQLMADPALMAANNRVVAEAQLALERLPLPTLAVINGPCFGGGFGIAAACDLRIGTPRSLFAITPARLGLLYSLEDTRRVIALVGPARAKRLLLRSERLDAEAALAWGVLDAVVEPEALPARTAAWVDELLAQSTTSLAGIKATVQHLDGHGHVDEAQVRALFDAAFRGPDFAEGCAAFLQRRPPKFS